MATPLSSDPEPEYPLMRYWQSDALFAQRSISTYVRWALFISILFNISLFVWSNSINVATVQAILDVRDREDDVGEVFAFNLGGSVSDMWAAKTYALAILLALFSGAWPYIKLISMFFAFVLPKKYFSFAMRDGVLRWLDILGKWSLLDTFFMVMMMVAFQFDLYVANGVEINVYVRAEWGFYAFLLATMMSLTLGHAVLYLHRRVTEEECDRAVKSEIHEGNSGLREAIMNHTYYIEFQSTSQKAKPDDGPTAALILDTAAESGKSLVRIKVTTLGKITVVVLIISCALAVIFGTFRNTFYFEFKGLTGFLMVCNITTLSLFSD